MIDSALNCLWTILVISTTCYCIFSGAEDLPGHATHDPYNKTFQEQLESQIGDTDTISASIVDMAAVLSNFDHLPGVLEEIVLEQERSPTGLFSSKRSSSLVHKSFRPRGF